MGNTVFLIGPGDVIGFVMELGGSIGHCNSETGVADKAKVVVTASQQPTSHISPAVDSAGQTENNQKGPERNLRPFLNYNPIINN